MIDPQYDDQISEHIVDFLLFQALQLQPIKIEPVPRSKPVKYGMEQLDEAVELFVSNIVPMNDLKTPRQQDPELLKLFERYGRVAKIKFVAQTLQEEVVKAYIEYANDPTSPQRAIDGLHKTIFRGAEISVEYLADAKYRRRNELKGKANPNPIPTARLD